MGFSSVLASGVMMSTLLLVGASLIYTLLASVIEISEAIERSGETRALKLSSQMQILGAQLKPDKVTLTFVFSNNGTVGLWNFEKFDLIVSYTQLDTGQQGIVKLDYGKSWQIDLVIVNGGRVEPFYAGRVIEPSEAAQVTVALPTRADPAMPIRISFTNQYGYTVVYKFVAGESD
uniref:Flagellin n=1 Tax=Fervidicoccus fontis TaxID=683846 RepID=A0A7J3ZNJ6_9CREN